MLLFFLKIGRRQRVGADNKSEDKRFLVHLERGLKGAETG